MERRLAQICGISTRLLVREPIRREPVPTIQKTSLLKRKHVGLVSDVLHTIVAMKIRGAVWDCIAQPDTWKRGAHAWDRTHRTHTNGQAQQGETSGRDVPRTNAAVARNGSLRGGSQEANELRSTAKRRISAGRPDSMARTGKIRIQQSSDPAGRIEMETVRPGGNRLRGQPDADGYSPELVANRASQLRQDPK